MPQHTSEPQGKGALNQKVTMPMQGPSCQAVPATRCCCDVLHAAKLAGCRVQHCQTSTCICRTSYGQQCCKQSTSTPKLTGLWRTYGGDCSPSSAVAIVVALHAASVQQPPRTLHSQTHTPQHSSCVAANITPQTNNPNTGLHHQQQLNRTLRPPAAAVLRAIAAQVCCSACLLARERAALAAAAAQPMTALECSSSRNLYSGTSRL